MARQVLPFVGAVIGSFFPGVGTQIGFMIGSLIGNAIDPQVIKGPSIGDGQTQTSKEGVPRPIIYGTVCVAGNIIAKGPIHKSIKRTRQGKGGPVTEEERMHMTWAIRICEGPVGGVLRIWEDEKLVYDIREGGQVTPEENGKYAERFKVYLGDETQLPDAALEVIFGAGNTPAYRGTCYIVFDMNDVTDRRGSIPNYRFEVGSATVTQTPPSLATNNTVFSGEPGEMAEEATLSWLVEGIDTFILHDASPDNKYLAAYAQVVMSGEKVCVIQGRQEDDSYEHIVTVQGDDGYEVSDFCFSNNGKWLAVFEGKEVAGVNYCRVKNLKVDDGSFSVIYSAEFEPHVRISLGQARWNESDQMIAAGVSYVSPPSNFPTFALMSCSPSGHIFLTSDNIMDYSGIEDITYLDWHPDGNYVCATSANLVVVVKVDTLETVVEFDTSASYRGCFFGSSGNSIYMFDQDVTLARSASFDPVLGLGDIQTFDFSANIPGFPDPVYRGSRSYDRNFYAVGLIGGQSTNEAIGYIFEIDEDTRTISFAKALNSTVDKIGTGRSVFSKTQTYSQSVGQGSKLGFIIKDIADRCKVDTTNIDVQEVEDVNVRGFVIAQQYAAQNTIRSLQNTFFFDPGEWDERVHFVKRGHDVKTTLTIDNLYDDEFDAERKNAFEFPRKLDLIYQNAVIGYDSAKATAFRNDPNVQGSGSQTIEVPVVLTEDEAAQVADKQLKVAWAEVAGEVNLSISYEFDWLTPTDCVGVYLNNQVSRMRIEKMERADGVLKITGKIDRQSAYSSRATGIPLPAPTPPPPTITGKMQMAFLNTPALIDAHDAIGIGYYVAGTGTSPAYYGGVIERSVAGEEYVQVATVSPGVTMGYLVAPLAAASEHYPDTTNTLQVQLYSGAFESVSQDTLLRENNAVAISRPDGSAEILQFRDAEDLGNGLYNLSYLIRGRLNTGATAHTADAKVTFLLDVEVVPADATLINQELTHRGTPYGSSPEESDEHTHTFTPVAMQTEFPVDLLEVEQDGSNLIVSWSPRHRFGTDISPVASVNFTGYTVQVTDGSLSQSVDTLTPNLTFDATGFSFPLTVSVSANNRITGPGPATSEVVS